MRGDACLEGRTQWPRYHLQARIETPLHPSRARLCHQKYYSRQIGTRSHASQRGAREEAQRGTCRPGTLYMSACNVQQAVTSAEYPQNALPNHHCLMTQCRALPLIPPSQKWHNHLCQLAGESMPMS